jgi:predicted Zn-dependent protease
VSARHIASRFEQNKKIGMATMVGVLAGVIAGVAGGGAGAGFGVAVGSMAAGQQAQLNYSRVAERQADQISFKLMQPTGFNPEGMIGALTKIGQSSWVGSGNVPTYLLSHPAGTERMSNFESMLTNYTQPPKGKEAAMYTAYFPYFQTIMRARCHNPQEAERVFLREMEEDPKSFLPHFGLALIYKQNTDFDRAEHHFYKALEKKKDFPPLLTSLGKLHQLQGEYDAAIPCYEKALKIEAKNKETLFLLGEAYRHLEEYEKSVAIFERLVNLKPVKTEVFQQLGISYGRQDKLLLAHYNFGIYFKRLRDAKKARFHFEKAQKLVGSDTVLREKIRKELEGIPIVR